MSAGATSKIAMRDALTFLQDRSRERLNGVRKTCMIHAKVHITGGGDLEKRLCAQFQSLVVSLGEVLCCDEKLFRFTGMGGIVRKVPSKPARIGTIKEWLSYPMRIRYLTGVYAHSQYVVQFGGEHTNL